MTMTSVTWRSLHMLPTILVLLALTTGQTAAESSSNDQGRALVLVDSLSTRETHSQILQHLNHLGLQVTLRTADDPSLQLVRYGQHVYDHVLLLSPYVQEFGGAVNIRALIDFVDAGGNLLVTGNDRTAESVRELAAELGVEFDRENRLAIDHSHFDRRLDNGSHSALSVASESLIDSESIVGKIDAGSHILYRGTVLFTSKVNPLLFKVLPAPATAYSHIPYESLTEVSFFLN
jgi:oligosaccharyltransferase complex subunit beta